MKTMSLIVNELLVRGATVRLEELNKERETLIKLIERRTKKPTLKLNIANVDKTSKRLHWTQTPEGRVRMGRAQKKAYREGRSGLLKVRKNAKSK